MLRVRNESFNSELDDMMTEYKSSQKEAERKLQANINIFERQLSKRKNGDGMIGEDMV